MRLALALVLLGLGAAGASPSGPMPVAAQEMKAAPTDLPIPAARVEYRRVAEARTRQLADQLETKAWLEVVARDIEQLKGAKETPLASAGWEKLPELLKVKLIDIHRTDAEAVRDALFTFVMDERERVEESRRRLTQLWAFELQQQAGRDQGNIWHWLSPELRRLRLAWCLLFLSLALIYWHVVRNDWRRDVLNSPLRWLRSIPLRAVLRLSMAATVVVAVTFVDLAAAKFRSVSKPLTDSSTDAPDTLRAQREAMRERYAQARRQWLDAASEANRPRQDEGQAWDEAREALAEGMALVATNRALADEVRKAAVGMEDRREEPEFFDLSMAANVALVTIWSAMGACLLVFARRRGAKGRRTCPLCLCEGKLVPSTLGSAGKGKITMLRCTNEITDATSSSQLKCSFEFLTTYQPMRKLYFPTLGHPTSGKTMWLAMTYNELTKGNYDSQMQVSSVESTEAETIRNMVHEVIREKIDVRGSQTARIPAPLLFNFRDRDLFGRSNVLVNIFDYSGEVTQRYKIDHPQRQRALMADGYFYFLDPTKTSEEQAHALNSFHEDVRAVTEASQATFRAPVALCVPKIDLLVNQPYNGPEVDDFYQALADIDPTGLDTSLRTIKARSELMREMRDVIWQRWNIENQIRELFGDRYMFFPLTPIGMNELGETDLRNRTIVPYHILEPMLWLLHMNGYPVLN